MKLTATMQRAIRECTTLKKNPKAHGTTLRALERRGYMARTFLGSWITTQDGWQALREQECQERAGNAQKVFPLFAEGRQESLRTRNTSRITVIVQ